MRKAFLLALVENLKFAGRLLIAIPCGNILHTVFRLLLFPLIWLALFSLTLLHFFFFFIDELLFSAYRKVAVRAPVFVLGIPRSGTTWLQRVLANDKQLSTLTLAEALFAPSITQRYLLSAVSWLLSPLAILVKRLPFQPLKRMDTIHKIRFSEPEEDFILLLPLHACFLLLLLCPKSSHYWKLARFDSEIAPSTQKVIMHFYALCIKKHLYFHGEDLGFLSKNPSFTPFLSALKSQFPDAHFVACTRAPEKTVPSQLNSLKPMQDFIGIGLSEARFNQLMVDVLLNYYKIIDENSKAISVVEMQQLNTQLEHTVKKLYCRFDKVYKPEFAAAIQALAQKGRNYKSEHHYDLSRYHITPEELAKTFSPYWPIEHNLT